MTEIYLHFRCAHYGLYGNAPVDDGVGGAVCLGVVHVSTLASLLAIQPAPVPVPNAAEQRLSKLGHGDDRPMRQQQPMVLRIYATVMRKDCDALPGRVGPLRGGVQQALGKNQQRALMQAAFRMTAISIGHGRCCDVAAACVLL